MMGPPQRQQPDQARPPGSVWVWVVAAVLLLCLLAGGGCLMLYLTLPPAEAPQWLAAVGLGLVALPWAFWIVTCAYRCCCSANAAVPAFVEQQPSSRRSAVVPLPSSKSLKSALAGAGNASARRAERSAAAAAAGSPTASSGTRRVRFGEATVLGEDHAAAEKDDGSSSVHSNESEAPLASSMHTS